MRQDVLSEMSGILKARYLISERILFHPTKCAAGAMLGTVIQLLGLRSLPPWMQALGDSMMLNVLNETAINVGHFCDAIATAGVEDRIDDVTSRLWPVDSRTSELVETCLAGMLGEVSSPSKIRARLGELQDRIAATRVLLWKLTARRFPKLVYRLRSDVRHSGGADAAALATNYCERDRRYALERKIEKLCALPLGSVFIHCPPRGTSMKVAQALVVGRDLTIVSELRDVTTVCSEGLAPYQDEIRAVEEMYKSIWQFHAYLDVAQMHKKFLVGDALAHEIGFPNDTLLTPQLESDGTNSPYDLLARDLKDEVALIHLPKVIARLDAVIPALPRFGETKDSREVVRRAIREIGTELHLPPSHLEDARDSDVANSTTSSPTLGSKQLELVNKK
jgi:hypothetical protein